MKKGKFFIVKGEIYPFDVFVYFGDSDGFINEFSKAYPHKKKTDNDFELTLGMSITYPDGTGGIWMKNEPKDAESKAILSHEIFHHACFIMRKVGIEWGKKSEEAFAYLIEYLTRKIYENLE